MLNKIKLIALDVDGVLTDGAITFLDNNEAKSFNSKDGFGITMGIKAGLTFAIITGRTSKTVERRAKELKIQHYYPGQFNKLKAFREIANNFQKQEIMFIGDDILDLVVKNEVGLFVAPADAVARVQQMADIVLKTKGGKGAVREAIDMVLDAQNKLTSSEDFYINNYHLQGFAG